MTLIQLADKLTTPATWPRWLRRTFLLTFPLSGPLYAVIVMSLFIVVTLALPILWLWEEAPELWR